MATAYIQFTSRLKATSQEGILAEAQQIAVSATDKTDIKTYVDSKVGAVAGSVYRPKGSVTAAQLKALTSAAVGDVYNVTDALTLGSKTYPAGTNVACLKAFSAAVTPDETYWDALSGFVDLSPYAKATDLSSAKSDLQTKIDAANSNISTINSKLSGIASGAQVNVIETVKVNGSALAVSSKAVNIDLSEYAKTSALATTNQAVSELKNTVDGIGTSLDDIYTKDEVDNATTANAAAIARNAAAMVLPFAGTDAFVSSCEIVGLDGGNVAYGNLPVFSTKLKMFFITKNLKKYSSWSDFTDIPNADAYGSQKALYFDGEKIYRFNGTTLIEVTTDTSSLEARVAALENALTVATSLTDDDGNLLIDTDDNELTN